ncbi:hypothetical protein K488DRAFT_74991 [Vararia minispora EC-137]|uniref:Uncharacterized protein n=1 Tax=Vararia minispora EC-137 TaxID=1314806 RepID=A0ACB8Q5C6_9AGAM|nr:hypothetical protein K488DRAFT_74991 [Vararia minispora EC-137]
MPLLSGSSGQLTTSTRRRLLAEEVPWLTTPREPKLKRRIARFLNVKGLSFQKAEDLYGVEDFERILCDFIAERNHPDLPRNQVANIARAMHLPCKSVAAYHRLKFWHPDALERDSDLAQELSDCIHTRPGYHDTQKRSVPGQFNTALVNEDGKGEHVGVAVRLIFSLSEKVKAVAFYGDAPAPSHMAYIEWFSRFPVHATENMNLYHVRRSRLGGEQVTSIIPIEEIWRSVHLIPKFGRKLNCAWTGASVLDECQEFYHRKGMTRHNRVEGREAAYTQGTPRGVGRLHQVHGEAAQGQVRATTGTQGTPRVARSRGTPGEDLDLREWSCSERQPTPREPPEVWNDCIGVHGKAAWGREGAAATPREPPECHRRTGEGKGGVGGGGVGEKRHEVAVAAARRLHTQQVAGHE